MDLYSYRADPAATAVGKDVAYAGGGRAGAGEGAKNSDGFSLNEALIGCEGIGAGSGFCAGVGGWMGVGIGLSREAVWVDGEGSLARIAEDC